MSHRGHQENLMTPKIHVFRSSRRAYNESQYNDKIKDGDILVIPSEKVVGFLLKAWPVSINREYHGEFHTFEEGTSGRTIENGRYRKSTEIAERVYAKLLRKHSRHRGAR